jgi:hypothetical protein
MEKKGISSWFCTDCCPGIEDVENRDVRGVSANIMVVVWWKQNGQI